MSMTAKTEPLNEHETLAASLDRLAAPVLTQTCAIPTTWSTRQAIDEKDSDIAQLSAENDELRARIDRRERDYRELEKKLREQELATRNARRDATSQAEQAHNLRDELETQLARARPLPPSANGCNRCPRMLASYDTLDEAFNDMRREKTRLASSLEESKNKVKELKDQVSHVKDELVTANRLVDRKDRKLDDQDKDIHQLERQVRNHARRSVKKEEVKPVVVDAYSAPPIMPAFNPPPVMPSYVQQGQTAYYVPENVPALPVVYAAPSAMATPMTETQGVEAAGYGGMDMDDDSFEATTSGEPPNYGGDPRKRLAGPRGIGASMHKRKHL